MARPKRNKEDCYDQPLRVNLKGKTMDQLRKFQEVLKLPNLADAARMFIEQVENVKLEQLVDVDRIKMLSHQ